MGFSETVHAEWQREQDRRRRIEEESRRQVEEYLDRYARERRLDGEGGRTYTFR